MGFLLVVFGYFFFNWQFLQVWFWTSLYRACILLPIFWDPALTFTALVWYINNKALLEPESCGFEFIFYFLPAVYLWTSYIPFRAWFSHLSRPITYHTSQVCNEDQRKTCSGECPYVVCAGDLWAPPAGFLCRCAKGHTSSVWTLYNLALNGALPSSFWMKQLRTHGTACSQEPKSTKSNKWLLLLCRNHGCS